MDYEQLIFSPHPLCVHRSCYYVNTMFLLYEIRLATLCCAKISDEAIKL